MEERGILEVILTLSECLTIKKILKGQKGQKSTKKKVKKGQTRQKRPKNFFRMKQTRFERRENRVCVTSLSKGTFGEIWPKTAQELALARRRHDEVRAKREPSSTL